MTTQPDDAPRLLTWSIVTTCNEPRVLVERFLAHHLAVGVERIFLFFDDPSDVGVTLFAAIPRVTVVACDDAYWGRLKGGRPDDHRQRQVHNCAHAAQKLSTSDWIANIDTDEFIHPRTVDSIGHLLAEVPEDLHAVRLLPAEHVFRTPPADGSLTVDGTFKLRSWKRAEFSNALLGDFAPLFPSGFIGHEVGKSFMRRGAGMRFNIHFARKDGVNVPEHVVKQDVAVLLHAFPSSFDDFKRKFDRRVNSPDYMQSLPPAARSRFEIYAGEKALGPDHVRQMFQEMCLLTPDKAAYLEREKLALEVDLALDRKIAAEVTPHAAVPAFAQCSSPSVTGFADHQRIFQIGMDGTGAIDLCADFARRGVTYCHSDNGAIAADLARGAREGSQPFDAYRGYQMLGGFIIDEDRAAFGDVAALVRHFPDAVYILNYCPVEDWIRDRAGDRTRLAGSGRPSTDVALAHPVSDAAWRQSWLRHIESVRALAGSSKFKLIDYPIYCRAPGEVVAQALALMS